MIIFVGYWITHEILLYLRIVVLEMSRLLSLHQNVNLETFQKIVNNGENRDYESHFHDNWSHQNILYIRQEFDKSLLLKPLNKKYQQFTKTYRKS